MSGECCCDPHRADGEVGVQNSAMVPRRNDLLVTDSHSVTRKEDVKKINPIFNSFNPFKCLKEEVSLTLACF